MTNTKLKQNEIKLKGEYLKEYNQIIEPIISNIDFQKRKEFVHHENESVYEHSLRVSVLSYKIAKKIKVDYKSAAIGGLLHDFYTTPWQEDSTPKPFFQKHGFTHAKDAHNNAKKYFSNIVNPKIENIILRHMFPLNITPPKYIESWIVTISDKIISASVLMHPSQYTKYLGMKRRNKKWKKK